MSIETANQLYKSANYDIALESALSCVTGADDGVALLIAAKCLLALGNVDGLSQVIAIAQQRGVSPEQTLLRVGQGCLSDGMREPLIALEGIIPESNILHPIALYQASCARMMLGDDEGAAAGFNRFRLCMPRFLNSLPFGTDDDFNVMFRQGTLVLPPAETSERLVQGTKMAAAQTEILIVRSQEDVGAHAAIMCCADARYIEHFLPRWLAPLVSFAHPIHVHVINPAEGSFALIDAVASEHDVTGRLSVSVSCDARNTATSYACARFEIVPILLEILRRPLLALDIDVAATPMLGALLSSQFNENFGCFETGRFEPASVHQASIMTFTHDTETLAFVQDLAAFCRPKLYQPVRLNWMLDQAALFSVIRLYRQTNPAFNYGALDRITARPMGDYVRGLASDEEKHAIKVKSAGMGSEASSLGVEEINWQP